MSTSVTQHQHRNDLKFPKKPRHKANVAESNVWCSTCECKQSDLLCLALRDEREELLLMPSIGIIEQDFLHPRILLIL